MILPFDHVIIGYILLSTKRHIYVLDLILRSEKCQMFSEPCLYDSKFSHDLSRILKT